MPDPDPTSGNTSFDHMARERFEQRGIHVLMLPDPLGGQWTQAMTPEQAEWLADHLKTLAALARRVRYATYPALYPEDGPDEPKETPE